VALTDTPPEVVRQQVELVQRASTARRFESARSLTRTVSALSMRALRRRNPDATKSEIDRLFAELHYGTELVNRLMGAR
jgi:hypothetical protein